MNSVPSLLPTLPTIVLSFCAISLSDLTAQSKESPADPLAAGGNVTPRIVQLTPEEEAEILKDVTVPPEFEVQLFAPAETANYPVYVAAAPNGDLYVSSDGNGSLGRDPDRGRVLRLRDHDNDGRADEVTEFISNIDSPRGLIWDHDRLYLLHPPHISVHFDRNDDGIAEESVLLIERIAFGFKDRPADHTTNGLELGLDGWIYIAGGDFGFLDALGADGRRLQHRGGGVIRFRPDGSGLELFATGTRNILGTPMSPLLDLFARDNTNDGGGWDVRFHHFSGLEDHGYPRLYMNFPGEHIHPLADYGGGSGCGSVYIHEPGFPAQWANAPFTCDWGRAASFRHRVKRRGAGFVETEEPIPFIKMTRPTDADVDGMSRVYQASWKGPATFRWNGPDVGYIVQVKPKNYQPTPLPDYLNASDEVLVSLLDSDSHVRTLAAQRALLRRPDHEATARLLRELARNPAKNLRARVAALFTIAQRARSPRSAETVIQQLTAFADDPALEPFALRALGDMPLTGGADATVSTVSSEVLVKGLTSANPRSRTEAMVTAARQQQIGAANAIADNLAHTDPVLAHTAFQALARLNAYNACFRVLDATGSTPDQRLGAAYALMRMHDPVVVENLIGRLGTTRPSRIGPVLTALTRLYQQEGSWKGDSWGTRPDTRGPYYQPETWSESAKILNALKTLLADADPEVAAALVQEMNRNRIQSNEALTRIIELASRDDELLTSAISQLVGATDIPSRAVPLVLKAASLEDADPMVQAQTVQCLTRIAHPEAMAGAIAVMDRLENASGAGKARQVARQAFFSPRYLETQFNQLRPLLNQSASASQQRWSHAALLTLLGAKNLGPEVRDQVTSTIDLAWQDSERRVLLIQLAAQLRSHALDNRIRAALSDFDPEVAKAARTAARRLRIPEPGEDTSPKIETLTAEEAVKMVLERQGDLALGEAVFSRAACATCHTVNQDQDQKGPYLGNIANTYRRPELAESILLPNKTIAQGFATNVITLNDETEYTGFITNEAVDRITLRDVAGQQHTIAKSVITERTTTELSIMPPGLMSAFSIHELASLLDYLESLAGAGEN